MSCGTLVKWPRHAKQAQLFCCKLSTKHRSVLTGEAVCAWSAACVGQVPLPAASAARVQRSQEGTHAAQDWDWPVKQAGEDSTIALLGNAPAAGICASCRSRSPAFTEATWPNKAHHQVMRGGGSPTPA